VRFLVDRCAGRRLAEALRGDGHDVVHAPELGSDPGDEELLRRATAGSRILVTIDTDFGALVFGSGEPHCGIVRLPDVPATRRIALMRMLLERHPEALSDGAVVTVRGGRVRITRP
jgi:predicted nuclease of predicted toxin-antitoxin system